MSEYDLGVRVYEVMDGDTPVATYIQIPVRAAALIGKLGLSGEGRNGESLVLCTWVSDTEKYDPDQIIQLFREQFRDDGPFRPLREEGV